MKYWFPSLRIDSDLKMSSHTIDKGYHFDTIQSKFFSLKFDSYLSETVEWRDNLLGQLLTKTKTLQPRV